MIIDKVEWVCTAAILVVCVILAIHFVRSVVSDVRNARWYLCASSAFRELIADVDWRFPWP